MLKKHLMKLKKIVLKEKKKNCIIKIRIEPYPNKKEFISMKNVGADLPHQTSTTRPITPTTSLYLTIVFQGPKTDVYEGGVGPYRRYLNPTLTNSGASQLVDATSASHGSKKKKKNVLFHCPDIMTQHPYVQRLARCDFRSESRVIYFYFLFFIFYLFNYPNGTLFISNYEMTDTSL
jgi:hypothetical protein